MNIKGLFKKDFTEKDIIDFILLSVITIMPFIVVRNSSMPFMTGKVVYLYIIGIILLIFFLKQLIKIKFKKEEVLLSIFIIALTISTIFSFEPITSLLGADGWNEGLLMYVIYFILFIFSINYFKFNEKRMNVICIMATFMGIHTVLQFYGIDFVMKYFIGVDKGIDTFGTIGNRNFAATYIVIFALISISMYIFSNKNRYLIYSCILFSGLLATLTRGAWIGFALALLVGGLLIIKERKYYKKIVIIILLFTGIFITMNLTNNNILISRSKSIVSETTNLTENSGNGRIKIWLTTIECIKRNPILGTGIDTLNTYAIMNGIDNDIKFTKAHNEFLAYWLSGGIVTLISYLLLVGFILKKLYMNRENNMSKMLIVVIVGYLVQSFFNISVLEVAPIYWILLGASIKFYRELDNEKSCTTVKSHL